MQEYSHAGSTFVRKPMAQHKSPHMQPANQAPDWVSQDSVGHDRDHEIMLWFGSLTKAGKV